MNRLEKAREGMHVDDWDNLRQMLGMNRPRAVWGHQNRMWVRLSDELRMASMERMCAAGLVVRCGAIGPDPMYAATRLGCELAGLPERRIQRALGELA